MKLLVHLVSMATAALYFIPFAQALTAEHWLNLRPDPSILTLQREGIARRAANSSEVLASPTLTNLAAGTGVRLRGEVTPSISGTYIFAISGSRNATLWLSPTVSSFGKKPIAWLHEPTSIQQWDKFAKQQSSPVQLEAGVSYYVEAHVMSSTAGGHFAMGWKPPGATAIQIIPSAELAAAQLEPADLNSNLLPDAWEIQTGLDQSPLLGALAEHGDPDNDGIQNIDEFQLSSNPLAKETRENGLTLDTWQEIQGQSVEHLRAARGRFLSYPNATSHVANIDVNNAYKIEGKNYGARYRGFLIAPVSGTYVFWLAGDDDAELWFADGSVLDSVSAAALTNRYGKQLLAHTRNPGGSYSSNPRDFDLIPSQRSRTLQLVEGQSYYIEVLHQNESTSGNHVSLAWTRPGQEREIVPSTAFHSDLPEDGDADNDALPDTWENLVGLAATDNGLISSKQGQYGDFDADGLTNLLEYQLRTNPKLADTDGDGLSDSSELNYYGTNPLVANAIATTTLTNLALTDHSATSVPWEPLTDGSIRAYERRGWTEWTFTVPLGQEGIHEIRLTGGGAANLSVPISFHLNGTELARQTLAASSTQNSSLKQLTPWLHAGTHTLRIQSHNVRTTNKLVLRSISIHRLGGTDADSNGIADWAEIQFNEGNKLTRLPTESLTSPAFLEGSASSLNSLAITRSVAGGAAAEQAILPGIDDGFYANVPLDADASTDLAISLQGGARTISHRITWSATNILDHNTLTIRQGDSLRLTAEGEGGSGTFLLTSSTLQASLPADPSNTPIPVMFSTPGIHTITATWTPTEGEPQTNTLIIHVRTADFGPAFILQTYNRRTWMVPGIHGMDIEADTALYWRETTAIGATSRSFLANAYATGEFKVIARVPETGEIISSGKISAFSMARATDVGDAQTVEVRPDGSQVIRFTIVAENLPPNAEIRITMNYQGTVFPDGSRTLVLRASDFSPNGIANVLVETSSDPPQLCHSMTVFLID